MTQKLKSFEQFNCFKSRNRNGLKTGDDLKLKTDDVVKIKSWQASPNDVTTHLKGRDNILHFLEEWTNLLVNDLAVTRKESTRGKHRCIVEVSAETLTIGWLN